MLLTVLMLLTVKGWWTHLRRNWLTSLDHKKIGIMYIVLALVMFARDMTFPFMNAVRLALTAAGAGLVMTSLVIGRFSTGGWSGYPPYTGIDFNPGPDVDYWIWAITGVVTLTCPRLFAPQFGRS